MCANSLVSHACESISTGVFLCRYLVYYAIDGLRLSTCHVADAVDNNGREPQGNRVNNSSCDEACKEVIVPAGGFTF
jgi:hypothetical protein